MIFTSATLTEASRISLTKSKHPLRPTGPQSHLCHRAFHSILESSQVTSLISWFDYLSSLTSNVPLSRPSSFERNAKALRRRAETCHDSNIAILNTCSYTSSQYARTLLLRLSSLTPDRYIPRTTRYIL